MEFYEPSSILLKKFDQKNESVLYDYQKGKEMLESMHNVCLETIEKIVNCESINGAKRVSPRTLPSIEPETLRQLVADMMPCLKECKNTFTSFKRYSYFVLRARVQPCIH